MSFKEMVASATKSVFLNFQYFAELHNVDGAEILTVEDSEELKRRQAGEELAIEQGSILFYCAAEDLPKLKKPGQVMEYDGRLYHVADVKEDIGMLTVVLEENIGV